MSVLNRTRRDNQQETQSALKASAKSAAPSRPKFKSRPKAARNPQLARRESFEGTPRQRNPQPNANGRPYAFPQAAALVQPNADRIQGRRDSAENQFQRVVGEVANVGDAAIGGGKAIGAGIGTGIAGLADQIKRGIDPNLPGAQPPQAPQTPAQAQPNAPANNMTPAEFQRLRNGESLPRSEIGQQTVAPAAEASGAPPQQPQMPGESPSGIYTFTDDNGVRNFTDQRVPGSEPYAPGSLSISGGGVGGAGPQFGGSGDVGGGMSAAQLGNTQLGQRIRQQVTGGNRMFDSQNGGTGIGGAPNAAGINRGIQQELQALDEQIRHGLTTNATGERLTVGGLNALMGRRDALTRAQTDLFGDQVDMFETGLNAQTGLQRQQLQNQGQLDRTALQGQMTSQQLQQRINDPLNQARAQAVQQEMQQFGVNIAPPALPDPAEMSMLSENQQAQIQQQYLGDLAVFSDVANLISENGGNVQAALRAADDLVEESPEDKLYKARVKAKLSEGMAGGAFVPRQSPTGFANGGLVQGPVQNFANGGLVGGQQPGQLPTSGSPNLPAQGGADAIQNYQKYVQLARQMKVPPVDFQQFAQMGSSQPSPNADVPQPELQRGIAGSQQVMGFADGGLVPQGGALDQMQADEKLVMDTDPNAPTDSIPATIDGIQPARLDSGEFVMPADVVQFFGTQKLQKLIEQARKPQEPQQSAGVQSGTPA